MLEVKSAKITEKGQICIPGELRKASGFRIGAKVAIFAYKDRMEVRPIGSISEKIETAIASERSLAKDWLSPEEDRAWKNL